MSAKNPTATRAKIFAAADEAFREKGLLATRLNRIVAAAGVSKGAFFHHFPTKEALYHQWLEQHLLQQLQQPWLDQLEESRDVINSLKSILQQQIRDSERAPLRHAGILTAFATLERSDDIAALALTSIHQRWQESISAALKRGQNEKNVHPSVNVTDEAMLIIGMSQGLDALLKVANPTAAQAYLRSAHAYLDTLRPS